jgi:hypothetical protein
LDENAEVVSSLEVPTAGFRLRYPALADHLPGDDPSVELRVRLQQSTNELDVRLAGWTLLEVRRVANVGTPLPVSSPASLGARLGREARAWRKALDAIEARVS